MMEPKKLGKYQKFTKYLKNLWNMKVTVITTIIGDLGTDSKYLRWSSDEQKNFVYRDQSATLVGWDTKKSPRDLTRITVTQTSVENHQLKLV